MMMHNADLADTLGNLLHRAANLTLRMCEGVVPDVPAEVIIDVARLRHDTEVAFQSYALQARVRMRFVCDAPPVSRTVLCAGRLRARHQRSEGHQQVSDGRRTMGYQG